MGEVGLYSLQHGKCIECFSFARWLQGSASLNQAVGFSIATATKDLVNTVAILATF